MQRQQNSVTFAQLFNDDEKKSKNFEDILKKLPSDVLTEICDKHVSNADAEEENLDNCNFNYDADVKKTIDFLNNLIKHDLTEKLNQNRKIFLAKIAKMISTFLIMDAVSIGLIFLVNLIFKLFPSLQVALIVGICFSSVVNIIFLHTKGKNLNNDFKNSSEKYKSSESDIICAERFLYFIKKSYAEQIKQKQI
jgi:hypothetical protein